MYSIVNIIYGIPLTQAVHAAANKLDQEPQEVGFETLYSGNAEYEPGFSGVLLGGLNDCADPEPLAKLIPVVTDEQKALAERKMAEIPPEIRAICLPPDVYLVWSTS